MHRKTKIKILILGLGISILSVSCSNSHQFDIQNQSSIDASTCTNQSQSESDLSISEPVHIFSISDVNDFVYEYYTNRSSFPELYEVVKAMYSEYNLEEQVYNELASFAESILDNLYLCDLVSMIDYYTTEETLAKEIGADPSIFQTEDGEYVYTMASLMRAAEVSCDELTEYKWKFSNDDFGLDVKENDIDINSLSQNALDVIQTYNNKSWNLAQGFKGDNWDLFTENDFEYTYLDTESLQPLQVFFLSGTVSLENYYNDNSLSLLETHYCLGVTPEGGTSIDKWYVYLDKNEFSEDYEMIKSNIPTAVDKLRANPTYKFACQPIDDDVSSLQSSHMAIVKAISN